MTRFQNREELANKILWEGGLEESFNYGITAEMLPEGETELIGLWSKAEEAHAEYMYCLHEVFEAFPELEV